MNAEIQRITSKDRLRETSKAGWKVLAQKLVDQARLEADHNKHIANSLSGAPTKDDLDGK